MGKRVGHRASGHSSKSPKDTEFKGPYWLAMLLLGLIVVGVASHVYVIACVGVVGATLLTKKVTEGGE